MATLNVCDCGKGRLVQFHCPRDDILVCKPCKYVNHSRCRILNIAQAARGIFETEEVRRLTKELKVLRKVFAKLQENRQLSKLQQRQERRRSSSVPRQGLWKRRESNNRNIQAYPEFNRPRLYGEFSTGKFNRNEYNDRKIDRTVATIDSYLTEITTSLLTHNESTAFIVYKKARSDIPEFQHFLNSLSHQKINGLVNRRDIIQREEYADEKDRQKPLRLPKLTQAKSLDTERRESKLSEVSNESEFRQIRGSQYSPGRLRFKPTFRPQSIRMPTVLSSIRSGSKNTFIKPGTFDRKRASQSISIEINVNRLEDNVNDDKDRDNGVCENYVPSMVKLRDGRFILLDCRGNRMKLFSARNSHICEMSMHSSLWDGTVVGNVVYVTCPAEGKIQKVQVTSDNYLFEAGVILTQKDCKAIGFYNQRLYVTFTGLSPSVKIFSLDGIIYKSIDAVQGNVRIFQNPLYIHVSRMGKAIYLSDFTLQRLAVIDRKGNLLHVYDVSPNWPTGMTADDDDNVILAVSGDNDIRLVTSEGERMKTLIPAKRLNAEPCSVMCKQGYDGQKLYVAFSGNDTIKMFRLTY